MVEQRTVNALVVGSSPTWAAIFFKWTDRYSHGQTLIIINEIKPITHVFVLR